MMKSNKLTEIIREYFYEVHHHDDIYERFFLTTVQLCDDDDAVACVCVGRVRWAVVCHTQCQELKKVITWRFDIQKLIAMSTYDDLYHVVDTEKDGWRPTSFVTM